MNSIFCTRNRVTNNIFRYFNCIKRVKLQQNANYYRKKFLRRKNV